MEENVLAPTKDKATCAGSRFDGSSSDEELINIGFALTFHVIAIVHHGILRYIRRENLNWYGKSDRFSMNVSLAL